MNKQIPLLLDAFLPGISSPFVGEGGGRLEKFGSPPSFLLSPAFAEAASRRQAPGERNIF
jgi:hypothetical protein